MSSPTVPSLSLYDYMKQFEIDYLDDFVAAGGSTVKFLSLEGHDAASRLSAILADAAVSRDYLHVGVDAAKTPVQFIEELLFAVSRQIDWFHLASAFVRRCYEELGMSLGAIETVDAATVRAVAKANDMHDGELHRSMRRIVEKRVLGDGQLTPDFRVAMLRTCQAVMSWGDVTEGEKATLLQWLHGNTIAMAKLRSIGLHRRITRHHARHVFASLCHWIRRCGHRGLVVNVDVSRFMVVRRPSAEMRRGFYYSRSAVLDTYEALRQFVDSTSEMEGVVLIVYAPRQLMSDPHRGPRGYHALHQRIVNEVHDTRRPNPMAALVRASL